MNMCWLFKMIFYQIYTVLNLKKNPSNECLEFPNMYLIIYLEFVASNTWQKADLYTFMFCMCQQYSLTSHHNYLCVTSSILGAGFDLFHTSAFLRNSL